MGGESYKLYAEMKATTSDGKQRNDRQITNSEGILNKLHAEMKACPTNDGKQHNEARRTNSGVNPTKYAQKL